MAEAILTSLVGGILSSIVASAMFMYFLFRLKPNLEISPYIAVQKTDNENSKYVFKIINRTRREVINVRIQLVLTTYRNVPDGKIAKNTDIPLTKSDVFRIAPFNKNDKNADYAYRISCTQDLNTLWNEDGEGYLRLRIIATDSLTNFSKVFIKEYYEKRITL